MSGFATPKNIDIQGQTPEGSGATSNPVLISGISKENKVTSLFVNKDGAPALVVSDQFSSDTLKEILAELKKMNFYLSNICNS
jgi:hypothetical protein